MIRIDEVEFEKILRAMIESAAKFTNVEYCTGFAVGCDEALRALKIVTRSEVNE